jgi:S1-C subfamily serine protease
VPADTARQVMEQLLRDGKVRRGWIGVEPRDLSAELAETLNLPVRQGVLITGVLQNGPAALGGLRPGDVVVQVGDKPVRNVGELFGAVAALPPEQEALIVAQRGDEQLRLKVKVGERRSGAQPAGR